MDESATARRLRLALDMYEVGERLQRCRLARLHPDYDEKQIDAELRAWRLRRPGADHGDCVGSPSHRLA